MSGPELLVGTAGQGAWRSTDDGETWSAAPGIPGDTGIFSFAGSADRAFAGGAGAIYRRAGDTWEAMRLSDTELQAWSVAVAPDKPDVVFAGCRPLTLLRSDDGGKRWSILPFELPAGTEHPHTPRVTAIHPEPGAIWCGVEVGGVFVSEDGGQRFTVVNDGLPSLDVHALARGPRSLLLVATNRGIGRFDGRWRTTQIDAPWHYCRALAPLPDRPGEICCALGDGPPGTREVPGGTRGAVVRSEDGGRSWSSALFPGLAASTVWSVAAGPADPDLVLAGAIGGELFVSDDAARTWRRLARTFTEIRAVAVL
jgi:photosystem II stability/assembly factor-like uncharacterized protein